jgi:hypothetical protein
VFVLRFTVKVTLSNGVRVIVYNGMQDSVRVEPTLVCWLLKDQRDLHLSTSKDN